MPRTFPPSLTSRLPFHSAGNVKGQAIELIQALQSQKKMSIPTNLVPDDWTTDPQEMRKDFYWGENGSGRLLAESVGITNPEGLMIKSRDAGGDGYVFQDSKGRIYLWSMIMDDVYQYTKPTGLNAILAEMNKSAGRGRVEMKLLPQISEIPE